MRVLHDLGASAGRFVYRKRIALTLVLLSGASVYLTASPYSERPEVVAVQAVLKGVAALIGAGS